MNRGSSPVHGRGNGTDVIWQEESLVSGPGKKSAQGRDRIDATGIRVSAGRPLKNIGVAHLLCDNRKTVKCVKSEEDTCMMSQVDFTAAVSDGCAPWRLPLELDGEIFNFSPSTTL
jgi:hypothetical protein